MATHVLVPIKSFQQAKVRLASALGAADRADPARRMAARVLAAARGLPTWVVCDDDEVATWSSEHGAGVLWTPGLGLNGAVADGIARITTEQRALEVIVAHADLPL